MIAGRAFDRLIAFTSPAAAYRRGLRFSREGDDARAFDNFVRAARAGLAEAQYRVARCYLEGLAVPRSRTHGLHWLSNAATHGSVAAQLLLAVLYLNGQAGESEAILAYIQMNAPPPLRDLESAHRLYARSAAGGCAQGHLGYAL